MKKLLTSAALIALLSTPAHAGTVDTVKDAITAADTAAADYLDGSWLEKVFSSVFGLTYLGAWFDGLGFAVPAGDEWIAAGGRDK